ncbi:hypothetical protein [Pseudocolwellia agarivorans]|uniref:hypothetical protein n=1 Tax=Pseudocolwellia agarivorans TaxID=1911682 RepID=UPI003F8842A6
MELKFKSIQDDKPIIKDILLSEEHSTAVFDARKKLLLILKMEELFDQIIESHLSFKKELYASALMISGYSRPSHIVTHEIRSKLNRIVFNTLNLSKLYLDKHHYEYKDKNTSKIQTTKCFAMEVTNIEDIQSRVKTHKNEVSKDNEKYKLGCSLRNIAQHSTLPIGEFDKDMNTINGNDGLTVNIHFNLPIEKKQLKRKVPLVY